MKRWGAFFLFGWMSILAGNRQASAQDRGLVNTTVSPFALLRPVDMDAVQWTHGFWAERFQVCKEAMVPNMWHLYTDAGISHAYKNFEIAAKLDTGSFKGPSFHDGDFYKTLESVACLYAATKDGELDRIMDGAIATIAKAQRDDGYIYTKAIIEQNKTGARRQFDDKLSFEAYNIGHLMTAACVHYRATGKTSLLNIAKRATDYLYNFYHVASPALARNAICPSHYMGVVEMYRTTRDPKYLELARKLIDIKGSTDDGTDDNQDRIPFRQQTSALGHAVRANYLYAGVADVYAETGDTSLLRVLNMVWDDVAQHKIYVTGGCGSLYNGVSPDGTTYNPTEIQQVQQAYGRDYQLPNLTAHNESCANIGNLLWNWRMLQITAQARYADMLELSLYNSILSGISLDGKHFLYTNPLQVSDQLPFHQRWSKDRVEYISLSNCCPPNLVRTMAEVSSYAYNVSDKGLWCNLYGSNRLSTKLKGGAAVKLTQETDYPWDGLVKIRLEEVPGAAFSLFLRIPGWSDGAQLQVNGKAAAVSVTPGEYAEINRTWKQGDVIELRLPMPVKLLEANPLVEEARNQVAVKRGPVVYCLESIDLPKDKSIFDIAIPLNEKLVPKATTVANSRMMSLEGSALLQPASSWKNKLYKEVSAAKLQPVSIRLVPYYAWGNRGHGDMSVWLPLVR
ncbi:MAG: glycoside hydrolase family 127 protein [Williamsia sp.]|nr:glycoside hydrolase family 127 protein [Williamsia sp.]